MYLQKGHSDHWCWHWWHWCASVVPWQSNILKKVNDVWYISSQSCYSISMTCIFSQEQKDLSNGLAKWCCNYHLIIHLLSWETRWTNRINHFLQTIAEIMWKKDEPSFKNRKISTKKRIISQKTGLKHFLRKTNCVNVAVSKLALKVVDINRINVLLSCNRARLARKYRTLEQGCFDCANPMQESRADRSYEKSPF